MRFLSRAALLFNLVCCVAACALAQTPQTVGTGTITGRITVGDKPAQGIAVMLLPGSPYENERKPAARATTEPDGQFRLMNVRAGRYEVVPVAPVFVTPGSPTGFRNQGKTVNLLEGETIEQIDFTLVRGGVVTGRVTDADGRPVIGERVKLALAEQSDNRRSPNFFNSSMFETDDRGVYRIYGISPGRYTVSVGEDGRSGMVRMGTGRGGFYTRTFHPGVSDESKANIIEVTEGSEATNVDITLGRRADTYAVSGSVVDAETGKPVTNVSVGYGSLIEGARRMGGIAIGGRTDAEGRFSFNALLPGRYAAFTVSDEQNDGYSVPTTFEISEGDVSGLVIKVRRGASIDGVVVIEGASDRAALAKLSQLRISAWPESQTLAVPTFGQGEKINPDGSFHIGGLRPGKVRLGMGGWPPVKGFSLLRIERDGVELRAGLIDIQANSPVTGVRLIFEYGTAIVRGQVRVENGTLPEGTRLYVSARRPNASEPSLPGADVDARGRFVIEGLAPGEYQLRLGGRLGNGQRIPPAVQNVNVTNGVETEVTLVLDLNAKRERERL